MRDVVILVPVLNRPHRVEPTLQAFDGLNVLFICDSCDVHELAAIQALGASYIVRDGSYGQKINYAVRATDEPLIFFGADDLEPLEGWLETAIRYIDDGYRIVGVNDLIQRPLRPRHATHFLVTREYAMQPCIDGNIGPCFEGYYHWCVDDELIVTGMRRDAYTYAEDVRVRHLHPMAGLAPDDSTYQRGLDGRRHDIRLFHRRRAEFMRKRRA